MTEPDGATPFCPYKGLVPFEEDDAPFFFGREAEREVITANLRASRLTVLYGTSGVGKTSLLHAGVAHHLRGLARQNREEWQVPELAVVIFRDWPQDPLSGLEKAIRETVEASLDHAEPLPPGLGWIESLERWTEQLGGPLLIVLDQFEDYFLYHRNETGNGTFANSFPRALKNLDLQVNFLIAIREDSLALLDEFKGAIPGLFDNMLRLRHLDHHAARRAIEEPLEEYNRRRSESTSVSVETDLVEEVLHQVTTGRLGASIDTGSTSGKRGERWIETPYLQLVMMRLWERERAARSPILRRETLTRLGGARRIVESHLETALRALTWRQRRVAAKAVRYLVTASGAKVPLTSSDLAELAELSAASREALASVLDHLTGPTVRILRPLSPPAERPGESRYEVYHDVLATPMRAWAADQVAFWKQVRGVLVGLGVFAILSSLTIWWSVIKQQQVAMTLSSSIVLAANSVEDPLLQALLLAELDPDREPPQGSRFAHSVAVQRIPRHVLRGHEGEVRSVAWSGDGRRLVSGSSDGTARLWHADGRGTPQVLSGHSGGLRSVAWNGDGSRFLTAAADGTIRLHRTDGGVEAVLKGHQGEVLSAAWSPDSRRIVTGGADKTVRLWDASSGSQVRLLGTHDGWVWSVAFSPDGRRAASASDDGTVRIWQLAGTAAPDVFEVPGTSFAAVAWSPDGRFVATGADDGTVRIWRLAGGELRTAFSAVGNGRVRGIAWSPDGRLMSGGSDGVVRQWDIDRPSEPLAVFTAASEVLSVAVATGGDRLAAGLADGTVRIWDLGPAPEPRVLRESGPEIVRVAWTRDGSRLLAADEDGSALFWKSDADEMESVEKVSFSDPQGEVLSLDMSFDGSRIAVASLDGARIWSRGGSRALSAPEEAGILVTVVAFTRDGSQVVTGDQNGVVYLRDARGQDPPRELGRHGGGVLSIAVCQDGRRILTGGEDGTARLWDLDGGAPLVLGHRAPVTALAFTGDDSRIVTATEEGVLSLWDTDSGRHISELGRHEDSVLSIAVSPDERWLAAGAADGTARLWSLSGDEAAVDLGQHGREVESVAFAPDGTRVVTGAADGSVRLFRVGWPVLLAYLRSSTTACLAPEQRNFYLAESYATAAAAAEDCEKRHGRGTEEPATAGGGPE